MDVSHTGLALIESFEGWVDHCYNDAAGHATIGYGHLLHDAGCSAADRKQWGTLTRAEGEKLLRRDAAAADAAVERLVKVPLNQHRFDALVSFVFNVGPGNFQSSTLLRVLNAGHYDAVGAQLMRWVNAGGRRLEGLVRRRAAEASLFNQPRAAYWWLSGAERALVVELDKLTAGRRSPQRRAAIKGQLVVMRQQIWRRAQPRTRGGDGHGWAAWHRDRRYRTLRAKTT